ncbi:Protein of unknown function [Pyronema omphalodes CBS 100304]|uniref:Uncharacterized protein n=1 Tax=Pyronema omphalodes (strain CBS 100304) TaxID=1076935 RepID=U4LLV0_PYROM|nr:Protein of unknown function [Pyronema omphalodes CBS 100304]
MDPMFVIYRCYLFDVDECSPTSAVRFPTNYIYFTKRRLSVAVDMGIPRAPRGSRRPPASISPSNPTANFHQTSHTDEPTAGQTAKQENTPLKPSNDTSQMTTRSGRRLGSPAATTPSTSKRVRNVTVARNWPKLSKSAAYQELVAESLAASCPAEMAKAETKMWNGRHGFAQEQSAQKGALKGYLVSYLESKEENVDGNGIISRDLSDHRQSDSPDSRDVKPASGPTSPVHGQKFKPSNLTEQSPSPQTPLCQNDCQGCQLPCTRKLSLPGAISNDLLDQSNEPPEQHCLLDQSNKLPEQHCLLNQSNKLPEQHYLSTQYDYSCELEPACIENQVDSVPPDSSGRRVSLIAILPIRQLSLQPEKLLATPSDSPDAQTSGRRSGRARNPSRK